MEASILKTIRYALVGDDSSTHFDTDIIMHINTALSKLAQIGIGPSTGFSISDDTAEWADFLGDRTDLEDVKTFIYLSVRLVFDPPQTSFVLDSIKANIAELEWRLNIKAEGGTT